MNETKELKPSVAQLAQYNQWVTWRYETRKGKKTKVPKNPATGGNAQSNNPSTWGQFQQAVEVSRERGHNGVGFMLNPDVVKIVGIDLDHCIGPNLSIAPWAMEIVELIDSYTEITPSSHGLRIFAFGSLPEGGRKKDNVEMYESGRFLTVTGQHLPGTPDAIRDRVAELKQAHEKVFGKPTPQPTPQQNGRIDNLDDKKIVDRAMSAQNGDRFKQLWEGDTAAYGDDHSRADLALCEALNFWTQGDESQIDRLFRESGLMRDKWDEVHYATGETYGQHTIKVALNGNHRDPDCSKKKDEDDESTFQVFEKSEDEPAEEPGYEPIGSSWADLQGIIGPIEWDWPEWLPRGFQVLLVAKPGQGKSSLMLHIVRCFLTGSPWPDGTPFTGETGEVLWCETESAQALNLERATDWGLPIDRIRTPLSNPLNDASLDDVEHQAAIYSAAQRDEVKLIVIDSLSGGTRKEAGKSNKMLEVGLFLAGLARDTGKPVLVSHHLRKKSLFDGDRVTLDMVRDSSAITQTARVIWAIDTPDIEAEHLKRLYVIKSNFAKIPGELGFEVTDDGLTFGDAPQPAREESQIDKAVDLLRAVLDKEPLTVSDLEQHARGAAISWPTMKRAKKKLNVVSRYDGEKKLWYWGLPTKEYF